MKENAGPKEILEMVVLYGMLLIRLPKESQRFLMIERYLFTEAIKAPSESPNGFSTCGEILKDITLFV